MISRAARLRALLVAALLALAALALWLARDGGGSAARTADPAAPDSAERADAELRGAPALDDARAGVAEPEARRFEAGAQTESAKAAPVEAACVVHGLVLDEDGAPRAGVLVRLSGYAGWAEGADAPLLSVGVKRHGWEIATDADGAFRFAVPVPTVVTTVLELEPDALHERATVYFSDILDNAQPALSAGERDLGAFRLATSGAIRGTVRDAGGLPIAGAELDVGTEPWNTLSLGGVTDETGAYLVPHVPAGSYCLKVAAHGFLPTFEKPVAVAHGLVAQGPDFALAAAPTLRGRVTDETGLPIEGARIAAGSTSNGPTASARTEADGAFVVYLPRDEPHRLEVSAHGFQPFGIGSDRAYEPGADGIEVVLAPDIMTRFVVVDPDGAPVERFGLRINRNKGRDAVERDRWTVVDPPRPRNRPGGELELGARPGLDTFELFAPGFEELSGEVVHDADAPGRQTLRLSRGCSLVGRVVGGGAPVAGARVTLSPGRFREDRTDAGEHVRTFLEDRATRVSVETGADGRFAFTGLDRGNEHSLTAMHAEKGVLRRVPVVPSLAGENELGDLELATPAAIAGELLLPAGVPLAGRTIFLGPWQHGDTATTDGDGRFRFDGLAPGEHVLFVDDAPGLLSAGAPFAVTVAAGATADVVLDCRDRAVAEVALRIDLGGLSPEGFRVDLRPVGAPDETFKLGVLDADGRVRGFVRAGGEAAVEVNVWGYATLRHPTERVPLPRGTQPERTVAFDLGGLELALPDGVAIPESGSLEVELGERTYPVRFGERGQPSRAAEVLDGGRRFRMHLLPPGVHDVAVRLFDDAGEVELVRLPGGGSKAVKHPVYEGRASVAIAAGAIAAVALP